MRWGDILRVREWLGSPRLPIAKLGLRAMPILSELSLKWRNALQEGRPL